MFPEKEKTYPGRKFIQALQAGLVVAIGVFSFMALTRSSDIEPDITPVPAVTESWRSETRPTSVPATAVPTTDLSATSALSFYNRGRSHHDINDFERAIELYTQALELDPTLTNAWLSRAVAYAESGISDVKSRNDFARYVQYMETERIEHVISANESLELEMIEGRVYALTFEVKAGDILNVIAKSVERGQPGEENVVDPLVLVYDAQGALVQGDDDTLRSDGSLVNMNSRVEDYEVTRGGTYTVLLTHAGGGSYGKIDFKLSVR